MNHLELETCIASAKAGNKSDMEKILEQYKPFIYKTAKSYNIKNHDITDLVQIGYMALMNAVSKYKLESNTFSTYAYNSIKNSFNYVARQNKKYINDFSLNTPISSEQNGCHEFIDCLESQDNIEDSLMKSESIKELSTSLSRLSKEERELILKLFYKGVSIKAYAEKKDSGYLKTVREKKKILGKLRVSLDSRLN